MKTNPAGDYLWGTEECKWWAADVTWVGYVPLAHSNTSAAVSTSVHVVMPPFVTAQRSKPAEDILIYNYIAGNLENCQLHSAKYNLTKRRCSLWNVIFDTTNHAACDVTAICISLRPHPKGWLYYILATSAPTTTARSRVTTPYNQNSFGIWFSSYTTCNKYIFVLKTIFLHWVYLATAYKRLKNKCLFSYFK